jgi:hypothetical protein
MRDGYDHISLFVSLIHVPVRLGDLFQRIAPVNYRFEMALFDHLFHSDEIFGTRPGHATINRQVPAAVR